MKKENFRWKTFYNFFDLRSLPRKTKFSRRSMDENWSIVIFKQAEICINANFFLNTSSSILHIVSSHHFRVILAVFLIVVIRNRIKFLMVIEINISIRCGFCNRCLTLFLFSSILFSSLISFHSIQFLFLFVYFFF